jgi:hypothetical protein
MSLVQHHVKYREIHGVDEVVLMEKVEHMLLHARLRLEGKCTIPLDELNRISHRAKGRTKNCKAYRRDYSKQVLKQITFGLPLAPRIGLRERIIVNTHTGNVSVNTWIQCNRGTRLHTIEDKTNRDEAAMIRTDRQKDVNQILLQESVNENLFQESVDFVRMQAASVLS